MSDRTVVQEIPECRSIQNKFPVVHYVLSRYGQVLPENMHFCYKEAVWDELTVEERDYITRISIPVLT